MVEKELLQEKERVGSNVFALKNYQVLRIYVGILQGHFN